MRIKIQEIFIRLHCYEHTNSNFFSEITISSQKFSNFFTVFRYRLSKIDQEIETNPSQTISLYRLGDYVDITSGPLVANTSLMFHFVVTAVSYMFLD